MVPITLRYQSSSAFLLGCKLGLTEESETPIPQHRWGLLPDGANREGYFFFQTPVSCVSSRRTPSPLFRCCRSGLETMLAVATEEWHVSAAEVMLPSTQS
jgi:hypothetical protein